MIMAAGHIKQTQWISVTEAIINIVLSLILVKWIGIIGVALGTLIAFAFNTVANIVYMKKYIFDMSLGWIIKVYLANLVAGVLAMCLFGNIVNVNSLVSMNMWGLTPEFLDVLEEGFKKFFEKEVPGNPLKAEYLIPIFIGELLEQGKMSVKVLRTNDTWYGMTYHEDVAAVKDSFKKMLENGVYKADLFSDF